MRFFASLNWRRWVTIAVTLFFAFLSGHLMQSVLTEPGPFEAGLGPSMQITDETSPSDPVSLPSSPNAASLSNPPVLPLRVDEARLDRTAGCEPTLTARKAPAATIKIEVVSPCAAHERMRLRQGPIVADVLTDDTGAFVARMPALEESALVTVELGTSILEERVDVPDVADFHLVVLQHDGPTVLSINAYEFGATDLEDGHVWSGAPKTPERALGGGGFLTSLGQDDGYGFEIYSVPVAKLPSAGVIRLTVDAAITPDTCAKEIRATAYQSGPLDRLSPSDIRVTLPDCTHVGDVLRLQNLFPDMRLALR